MGNFRRYISIIGVVISALIVLSSCEKYFNPDQEINIREDQLFDDWYEYRSVEMGMYGLQAELVEQIMILGELRGDLLQITENAEPDLVEIYNFNISKDNKYASPANFFRLISACNNFIGILKDKHPEILDPESPVTNFDKLYGEALCMRAWAYFNAVRIYGKVPFIYESLTTPEEIDDYLNSSSTYIDSVHITFGTDGYENDTSYNEPIILEKQYYDLKLVIDYFTNELENDVKDVGVNHYSYNNDDSWEVSIWNKYAMHSLLGIMYLTEGDLTNAVYHFEEVTMTLPDYRYQLDGTFANGKWQNIFTGIDPKEHIYTLWFNKSSFQQNAFQEIFDLRAPHKYMLKPTKKSIMLWESLFDNYTINRNDSKPWLTQIVNQGKPGDFFRGYGASYVYMKGNSRVSESEVKNVLNLKAAKEFQKAYAEIGVVDTVVWKYSIGKTKYDQDANFSIYRASGIHLWLAEAYSQWKFWDSDGLYIRNIRAEFIVNDGSIYGTPREQRGVRGRVGFGGATDGIHAYYINYVHDPETNEVIDYLDFSGNDEAVRDYLEDKIIEERARELAYEGERFYDLMRIAQKRNDPTYLAKRVSEKFPADRRNEIFNFLSIEENWYIPFFD